MIKGINLKDLSIEELEQLIKKAANLIKDLKAEKPSYRLALENGISDNSYKTNNYGVVSSYSGTATIKMANGSVWKATGYSPKGDAWSIYREGYIDFKKISS